MFSRMLTTLTLALMTASAAAQGHAALKIGDLSIVSPWIRASVPGQTNGAGYLRIHHQGKQDDRLLSVQSEAAERIELHTVITENGMARMRHVQAIQLPAGQDTVLAPGGYHVMFMKLKAPFKAGEKVAAVLHFERAGKLDMVFTVQPATYRPADQQNGGSSHRHHRDAHGDGDHHHHH